jgi:hypothetical protein
MEQDRQIPLQVFVMVQLVECHPSEEAAGLAHQEVIMVEVVEVQIALLFRVLSKQEQEVLVVAEQEI